MECHSVEQKKEKFIKEHLVANQLILDLEVRPIDVAQWPIELDIQCSTRYLEEL